MPSLSQPFRLASLPRLTSLSDTSVQTKLIQVGDDLSPISNKITIGISESAISQYILNPTPKLVLSVPIPSSNLVTACDVAQFAQKTEEHSIQYEIWCYALKAGKHNTLNIIINEMNSEKILNSSGEFNESKTLKLKDEVVSLKIKNERIVVVLKSGLIQLYDLKLTLVHSLDTSYGNVGIVNHFQENGEDFLFVLCGLSDNKVCFKLFELATDGGAQSPIKELTSIILEDFSLANSKICYQSGKMYRLIDEQILTYSLPQCQLLQKVKIPMISGTQVISMKTVSANRILLTLNNRIYLLDLIHNSILSERELSHVNTFQILRVAIINPQSTALYSNSKTIAIGVATKQGPNPSSSLEMINVDVGTGTLKDSLGKSFQPLNKVTVSHTLKPLFDDDQHQDDMNHDDEENDQENFDFENIYQQLIKCKSSISNFDNVFLNELNIKKEHYTEKDRFVCDPDFLNKVVHLIFDNFERDYPKSLTFLLTHPLFPVKCTKNLLSRFREHPRLFKQAIVTCPNIPLNELLFELFSIQNGELSLDISLRILQDYTTDMVREEIKKLSKVEVQNFIEFIINSREEETVRNSRQLFQLLSLVLDSIGLFALEGSTLHNLADYIDQQVAITERNSKLWYLLDDRQTTRKGSSLNHGSSKIKKESVPKYTVEYLEL